MASSKKKDEIKIKELCRTCLAKEIELFPIFDIILDTATLHDVISSITGVQIDKNDGLPKKICQECKDKAVNAYNFKRKSQEADVTLHDIFKKEKNTSSPEKAVTAEANEDINVKLENYQPDENQDYIDLEYNFDIPVLNNGYVDNIDVKNETSMEETRTDKGCNVDIDSDISQDQKKEKCIKVEYEYNSSTFCPLCGTCYADSDGLTKHMWDSHAEIMGPKKRGRPKKMVTDTILNKLSENGYYLKTIPVKRLSCSFCEGKFKTKEELVVHMTEHKETKVLCCVICKKMYLMKKYFDIHLCVEDKIQGSHLQENDPPIVLPKSENEDFMIETSLHQLLDLSNNPEACTSWQTCSACSALLATPAALADHVDALHPELSLRCALCNKVFATVKSASRHRSKCASVERAHECASCGQRFAHEVSLNKHILHSHAGQSVSVKFVARAVTDGQKYQCDTCNRCFFRKDLLAKHTKNHKSSDKFYECDICKKRFHRSDNLRSHMRVHGTAEGSAASEACLCLYCGHSFTNSSNLIVHMRRHTGEKPYKCDFCDKGFPRSSDLQCHRRSHTGEKPYICGVCGKGFSRSNKLSRHMRVHTGLRPYKCSYCDKAFSQSNDLNLHIRRHTGDKPYICEICGDRFIHGTALHNHRRTHGHYPTTEASSTSLPAPLPPALFAPTLAPPPPPAEITARPRR